MSRKNTNGAGSIYRDRSTNRWVGAITVGRDAQGRPRRRKVTGRTQAEVRERLEDLRRSVAISPTLPADVTVAAFLDHWLTEVLPLADLSTVTRDGYERVVRLYIAPVIGSVDLDELEPAHVRDMLAQLRDRGLSPNTMRQARSVLRRALRTAESDGLVSRNVARLVDGVKVGRPGGRTLTPEQARTLLSEAHGTPFGALAAVLLMLGLRKGEALGLTWVAVDLDAQRPTVTVLQSLKKASDGAVYLDEPKTAGSRRTLHLPGPVVDVLKTHRVEQHRDRLAFGTGWGAGWPDLVFTSSIGSPLDPDRVNREIKKITAAVLGDPWTPHELRHSAASLLLAQGVPLKTVSETLGHSSIRVTADVYGHLLEPARLEAADAMTAVMQA